MLRVFRGLPAAAVGVLGAVCVLTGAVPLVDRAVARLAAGPLAVTAHGPVLSAVLVLLVGLALVVVAARCAGGGR